MPLQKDPDQELIKDKVQVLVAFQMLDREDEVRSVFGDWLDNIQQKYNDAKAKSEAEIISQEEKERLEKEGIATDKITEAKPTTKEMREP